MQKICNNPGGPSCIKINNSETKALNLARVLYELLMHLVKKSPQYSTLRQNENCAKKFTKPGLYMKRLVETEEKEFEINAVFMFETRSI